MSLRGFLKIKTFGSGSPNNPIGEPRPFYILQNGVTVRLKGGYPAGTTGKADGDFSGKIYTAVSQSELTQLDKLTTDWALICTTLCTDFNKLFSSISLNPDIRHFDTSNVLNFFQLARFNTLFNPELKYLDVSKVITFTEAFRLSGFNQPINDWNMISASNTRDMFKQTQFNQPLNNWDVSNVTNMDRMFDNAGAFEQDISNWCVELIPSEPTNFSNNSPLDNLPSFKPNWGAACGPTNPPNKMTILTITN